MHGFSSINDMLVQAAKTDKFLVFYENNKPIKYFYKDIEIGATRLAGQLSSFGIQKQDIVILLLNASIDFTLLYFALHKINATPCILPSTTASKNLQDCINKTERIADKIAAKYVISNAFNKEKFISEYSQLIVHDIADIMQLSEKTYQSHEPNMDDIAIIQATSGSTGKPKCVALSQHNVLFNLHQMNLVSGNPENECGVSWLPVYHDMGLIVGFLFAFFKAHNQIFLTPPQFLKRPFLWFKAMHEFKATLSYAPNFAFAYACSRIKPEQLKGLDLSHLRILLCGSEMIDKDVLKEFNQYFTAAKINPNALTPGYGMAEAVVGVSLGEVSRPFQYKKVSRSQLAKDNTICEPHNEQDSLNLVNCGSPLLDVEFRIRDDEGNLLSDGIVGNIELKTPSAMISYLNDPESTAEILTADNWLKTGDLGFLENNSIYITGRKKEIIIMRGENYFPTDFEKACHGINGIYENRTAAFSVYNNTINTEELYIICEIDKNLVDINKNNEKSQLIEAVKEAVSQQTGIYPGHIGFVPRNTIPKTTSGKIQRGHLRKLYLELLASDAE